MLRRAPPMLLVGLALPFVWFAVEIGGALLQVEWTWSLIRVLGMPVFMTSNVLVAGGALELVRRTAGRARAGTAIATLCDLAICAVYIVFVIVRVRSSDYAPGDHGMPAFLAVYRWVAPALALAGVLGFAIAAGLRQLLLGVLATAITAVLFPLPPIGDLLGRFGLGGSGFTIAMVVLFVGRALTVALLGGAIASLGREPARDHRRAARGLRWLAIGTGLRAAALVIALVGSRLGDDSMMPSTVVSFAQLAAVLAIIAGVWLVARGRLVTLSATLVHLALATAIGTAIAMAQVIEDAYELAWGRIGFTVLHVPWWVDFGGTLALAWLVVMAAVYGRRRTPVARVALFGGTAFTLASGIGLALHGNEVVYRACGVAACIAVIPLLRVAAREVEADPVQTTADVFA